MSADKQKSLQAMRTFARDLSRERSGTEPTESPTPVKVSEEVAKEVKKMETPKTQKESPKVHTHVVQKEANKTEPKKIEHIPAFHELKTAVKTNIEVEPKKVEKQKKGKKEIVPTKVVGGGTVITDTKRVRKSFITELSLSLQKWWKDLTKSLAPKKKNTYSVTKTERRRGVVQKATSKTGTIFSADSETLREQIKARQRAEQNEGDDLNWSPFTEPGFLLLEGDEQESSDPRVEKVSVAFKRHSAPVSQPVEPPKPVPVPVIKPSEKIAELRKPEEQVIPEPVEIPEPTPTETVADIASDPEAIPVVADEQEVEEVATPEELDDDDTIELPHVSFKDTNTLALLLVGFFVGIGIIAFAIFVIIGVGNDNSPNEQLAPVTALYPGTTLAHITLSDSTYNTLVSQTNATLVSNNQGAATEYQFVNSKNQTVPAHIFMGILQTDSSDGFADSVTDVRFIKTNGQHRALMLTTSDTAVARGGMLNWENSLLVDVGGILDISTEQPSANEFTDTQYGELDVRVLLRGDQTLLVYSFIDAKHIIIGNDISVLTAFANR